MSENQRRSEFTRLRIVDVVFRISGKSKPWYLGLGLLIALGSHGSLLLLSQRSHQPLSAWASDLNEKVHHELTKEIVVDIKAPQPPVPEPPKKVEPPKVTPKKVAAPKSAAPAKAAAILAKAPDAPVDLTGETFVTGTADAYVGGVTASKGTSDKAVEERDESRPVSMGGKEWSCPWPKEAEAEQFREQIVIIKVIVKTDGTVESTRVLADPGHGFAEAAIACAQQTEFVPARDAKGLTVRSPSPPIRVRFTR